MLASILQRPKCMFHRTKFCKIKAHFPPKESETTKGHNNTRGFVFWGLPNSCVQKGFAFEDTMSILNPSQMTLGGVCKNPGPSHEDAQEHTLMGHQPSWLNGPHMQAEGVFVKMCKWLVCANAIISTTCATSQPYHLKGAEFQKHQICTIPPNVSKHQTGGGFWLVDRLDNCPLTNRTTSRLTSNSNESAHNHGVFLCIMAFTRMQQNTICNTKDFFGVGPPNNCTQKELKIGLPTT